MASESAKPKKRDERKRNWAFVVYPDSAPEDWREILRGELVPGFISPLHDMDANADGEAKKAHWHVLLTFRGNKSFDQVKEITDRLGAPIPQVCKDIRAYARYLCHLDNPEKAQYEVADVECLGGADYLDKIESAADTDAALAEMMDWCIEHRCYSFFRLSNYARTQRTDWFRVITSRRTVYLMAWLKSMEWEAQKGTLDEAVECFQHHEGHEQHHEQHDEQHEQHEQHAAKCCPICGSDNVKRNGKTAADVQRYQCNDCGKTFV